jgi:photosystem II stability/assembly factor-like uncharacterized protein
MRIILNCWLIAAICILCCSCNSFQKSYQEEEEGEEMAERGPEKQLSMLWWSRAYPEPFNINQKYWNAWLQFKDIQQKQRDQFNNANQRTNIGVFGNWASIGPSNTIGGRILCLSINPSNSNQLFAGSASGGIWKSTNAGTNWTKVETDLPVLGVAAIAHDPYNNNNIYAGTGEVYRTDTSNIGHNIWKARGTYGIGIIKSTDGGSTWTRVFNKNTSDLFGIKTIKFHPKTANVVFACATDGLYKTTNGGSSWSKILNKRMVMDMAIHPTNSDTMVVGVGNLIDADKGIYRTTNGGSSWTKISSALPGSFSGFIRLANSGSSRLYASIGRDDANQNELYLSTDFGTTWINKNSSSHCSYQFWFSHCVAVDPSNNNRVIMAGVSMYSYTSSSTTNGNGTRTTIGSGVHSDMHDIKWDPNNVNTVYVCCDGGIYKSTNNGSSWTAINNGLAATQFYASFACHPTNANTFIGGLQDNGTVRTTDNGVTWTSIMGGDGGPAMFNPTTPNTYFISNDARRVYRTTNGGSSYSTVLSSWAFTGDDRTGFMAPIAISKSNPNYVYAASDNWHRSTDGGATWNNDALSSTGYIEAQYKTGVTLAVSPTTYNKVYVSTSPFSQRTDNKLNINTPANFFRTTNADNSSPTFTSIRTGLPDKFVMDIAISPTNDDSLFIVLGGYGNSHIYVSGNGGSTWVARDYGLPDCPFTAILFDPTNYNILYAACDLGVYVSADRGASWYDFNVGFWDATQVMDLQISADNKLVAATHGKGVFKSNLFNAGVLPAAFLNINGRRSGNACMVNWQMAAENEVIQYKIERSTNGRDFTTIGICALGNLQYSYTDNHAPAGTIYYRIAAQQKDGTRTYSTVLMLKEKNIKEIKMLQNPFQQNITLSITTNKAEKANFTISNLQGKPIHTRTEQLTMGTQHINWNNVSYLASGTYFITITTGDLKETIKAIKIKN